MTEATIGQLLFSNQQQEEATLHCYCPQPAMLIFDLLDTLGRSYRHEKHHLSAGEHELTFSLQRLPPGEYNAWINIGDKTAIRHIQIQKRKEARSLFHRWFL